MKLCQLFPPINIDYREQLTQYGGMEMAKRNRGKALYKLPGRGRGECPICHRKRIKLVYERRTENNERFNVCKNCRSK